MYVHKDRSADAESMRERSRDYEERIEGFMHLILEVCLTLHYHIGCIA